MFRDPFYDEANFTWLELLQKRNFSIDTIKKWLEIELIKSDNANKRQQQSQQSVHDCKHVF